MKGGPYICLVAVHGLMAWLRSSTKYQQRVLSVHSSISKHRRCIKQISQTYTGVHWWMDMRAQA